MWRPSYGARGFFAPTTLGFRLEDVRPPVALHHGDIDALVPLSMVATSRITRPTPRYESSRARATKRIWPRWEEPPPRARGATMPVQRLVNRLLGYGKLFANIDASGRMTCAV